MRDTALYTYLLSGQVPTYQHSPCIERMATGSKHICNVMSGPSSAGTCQGECDAGEGGNPGQEAEGAQQLMALDRHRADGQKDWQ